MNRLGLSDVLCLTIVIPCVLSRLLAISGRRLNLVSLTLSWPEVKVHHTVIANQTMAVPKVTEHQADS